MSILRLFKKKNLAEIKAELGISGGFKSLDVLITQDVGDPNMTVLQDTIGGASASMERGGAGSYYLIKAGAFPEGKTSVKIGTGKNGSNLLGFGYIVALRMDDDTIGIFTGSGVNTFADDILYNTPLEIKVYP